MRHIEDDMQINCVMWFKYQYPEHLIHHSPNGGRRDAREGSRFKKMGVLSGFPDIIIPVARKGYHGLFIELKAEKNRLTQSQILVISKIISEGYKCEVCYSVEQFRKVVNDYFN